MTVHRERHGRKHFFTNQILFLKSKYFDILIGWTLVNTMLELNLSQHQRRPDICDTMLAPASYCVPALSNVAALTCKN